MSNTSFFTIMRILAFWLYMILCLIAFWWHIPISASPPLADNRFWSDGFHSLEHLPHVQRWISERATLYLPTLTTGEQRLALSLQNGHGDSTTPSTVSVQLITEASSARFAVSPVPRVYQVLLPNPKPLYLLTVTLVTPTIEGHGIVATSAEVYPLRGSISIPWWVVASGILVVQHTLLYALLTRQLSQPLRLAVLSLWLPSVLPWLWAHGYDSRGTVVLGAATVGVMLPYTLVRLSGFVASFSGVGNSWGRTKPLRATLYRTALLLPMLLYGLIAWHWNYGSMITLTGDEPHYLLIAASLAHDHDIALENNYRDDAIKHEFSAHSLDEEAHTIHRPNGWFSVHGIGIPLLLALPLSIAGVLGAKITLAMLIGLFPLVVFRMMRRVLGSQHSALFATLAIGLGLPFLAASNQIYPDLLTGVIVFTVSAFLLLTAPDSSSGYWRTLWLIALLIAYLPWLHIKNVAPMLLLTLWYCCMHLRTPLRLRWIAPLAIIAMSLLVFGIYNSAIYGSITGPYSEPLIYDPQQFIMILLGLHLDQSQGMFIQQPLLFVALLGIVPFWKHHRLGALCVGVIYLSLIMPNAMFPNWYGGLAFSGRFAWSSVLLCLFPLTHALKLLLERSKTVVMRISIYSIALQSYIALLWLPDGQYKRLYNSFGLRNVRSIWNFQPSYIDLQTIAPSFIDFTLYTKLIQNYIILAFCCVIIIISTIIYTKELITSNEYGPN